MKTFSKSLLTASLTLALSISALTGCGALNRDARQPGDMEPQGRNMIGNNAPGVDPNARLNGTNPNTGLNGTNPNAGLNGNNQMGNRQDNNFGTTTPDRARVGDLAGGAGNNNMLYNQTYNQQQVTEGRGRADNIKRQLEAMTDIRNVNVVVLGNSALVGFNTTDTTVDSARARDRVINRVKEIDNTVTNVLATDSQDMLPGITRLSSDIVNNRPVDTIGNNFNQMMRNLTNPGR